MRIYLDNIIFDLQKAGGISVYWYELCRRLSSYRNIFYIGAQESTNNLFGKRLELPPARRVSESQLPVQARRFLPFVHRLPGPALYHSSYYRINMWPNIANVVTVYDFTYELYRKGIPRLVNRLQKWLALTCASGVICISEHTRKDLLRFHPAVRHKRQKVIYLDVDESFHPLNEHKKILAADNENNRQDSILFVGDRKQEYKNFGLAVQAVGLLKNYRLIVVGGLPVSIKESDLLKRHLGNRYRIYEVPDTKVLNEIYNRSFCLVYPSLYEGFGLPVLEAMRAGCPVITTNRSSLPEVAGDAALYLSDVSVIGIVQAIKRLENPSVRMRLIHKGLSQARRFSWQRCVDETLAFYRIVFDDKFAHSEKRS